jgi:drug/metabolite transporter (DMT)-like permease
MTPASAIDEATKARLMLVMLSFAWGLAWPAMRIALEEVTPWTLRSIGFSLGAAFLLVWVKLQRRSFLVARPRDWLHLFVASMLNVVAFGVFSTFGQLNASTSRVIIVCYSMPVWSSLLAWLVLKERIGLRAAIGLALCMTGLTVLVWPVLETRSLLGLGLALGCAMSWAFGTVYMKWARISGDLIAMTAWQIVLGAAVMIVMTLTIQGPPSIEPLSARTWAAICFSGFIGTGVAFVMWFSIIGKLPTATASLGSLANPVVGIVGSVILLGERPPATDIMGFALIFAAAVCVLVQPGHKARTPKG